MKVKNVRLLYIIGQILQVVEQVLLFTLYLHSSTKILLKSKIEVASSAHCQINVI